MTTWTKVSSDSAAVGSDNNAIATCGFYAADEAGRTDADNLSDVATFGYLTGTAGSSRWTGASKDTSTWTINYRRGDFGGDSFGGATFGGDPWTAVTKDT